MDKRCSHCGLYKPQSLEYFPQRKKADGTLRWDAWCRECYRVNTRSINARNPEQKRQRDREWRESHSEEYKARRKLKYDRQTLSEKERHKEYARAHNNKLKRQAMEHYGGAFCRCCGETELLMLSLDHIGNNGAAHRKELTGTTRTMPTVSYIWARNNGWPPIYQVMCFNCNWARHWNNGICPHELARQGLFEGTVRINQAA